MWRFEDALLMVYWYVGGDGVEGLKAAGNGVYPGTSGRNWP